jgi:hypothetical protein
VRFNTARAEQCGRLVLGHDPAGPFIRIVLADRPPLVVRDGSPDGPAQVRALADALHELVSQGLVTVVEDE